MRVRRIAVLLVLIVTLVVSTVAATPGITYACSCDTSGEQINYADEADAAFWGRPIFEQIYPRGRHPDGVLVVFEVARVYKGDIGPRVAIHSGTTTCGIFYHGYFEDHRYGTRVHFDNEPLDGLLAYQDEDGELIVDLCSSPVSLASLVALFGVGHPPDESIALDESITLDETGQRLELNPANSVSVSTLIIAPLVAAAAIFVASRIAARSASRRPGPYESPPEERR